MTGHRMALHRITDGEDNPSQEVTLLHRDSSGCVNADVQGCLHRAAAGAYTPYPGCYGPLYTGYLAVLDAPERPVPTTKFFLAIPHSQQIPDRIEIFLGAGIIKPCSHTNEIGYNRPFAQRDLDGTSVWLSAGSI